jgi:hypothetical protein
MVPNSRRYFRGSSHTCGSFRARLQLSVTKPYAHEEGHIRCLSIQGSGTAIRRAILLIGRPSSLCTAFLARTLQVTCRERQPCHYKVLVSVLVAIMDADGRSFRFLTFCLPMLRRPGNDSPSACVVRATRRQSRMFCLLV